MGPLLWNPVHFTREELTLRKVTQPGKKFKVSSLRFSRPGHCGPLYLVTWPSVIGMYSMSALGARLCDSAGVGAGVLWVGPPTSASQALGEGLLSTSCQYLQMTDGTKRCSKGSRNLPGQQNQSSPG